MARIIVTELTREDLKVLKTLKDFFGEKPNSKLLMEAAVAIKKERLEKEQLQRELGEKLSEIQSVEGELENLKQKIRDYFTHIEQAQLDIIKSQELQEKNRNVILSAVKQPKTIDKKGR